jgi:hypothetical protein
MAIVCMVDKSNLNITSEPPINSEENYYEPVTVSTKYGSQFLDDKKYKWSEFQQQILLGAYWFGYIFTLLLSTFFFEKFPLRLFFFCLKYRWLAVIRNGC